jgi:hypothetical protein
MFVRFHHVTLPHPTRDFSTFMRSKATGTNDAATER